MKLIADYHTHSKNSRFGHGKSSIEEMALEANERGLAEIGITDHGYAHFFRTTKEKIKKARELIDDINEWSKTKVLLGIEADIISDDGTLDVDNETLAMLDILIISYHRMTFTNFANFFGVAKKTKEAKQRCTNAFINAIKKYPVTIVAHLDSILTTDLYEIGKVCAERGTMVEINNRHTKWNEKQVEDLIASGCLFVVSSDAHTREKVAEVDRAIEYIKKYNIPSERVVNIEFSEEEKSEADREFTVYKTIYDQLEKTKREKEEKMEIKRKTEITGNLSAEMEAELRKIAGQKGLKYEERKSDVVDSGYMKSISELDQDLIDEAEEYIRNQKLEKISEENSELGSIDGEDLASYRFNDDHPLLKDTDSFEDRFQPINKVIVDEANSSNEETVQRVVAVDLARKNVSQPEIEDVEDDSFDVNAVQESAYDQLNSSSIGSKDFKNIMSQEVQKEEPEQVVVEELKQEPIQEQTKQVFKKVEPENFMESITRTKLVDKGEVVEVPVEQKQKIEKKPIAQKSGRRGAFIAVDNLIGDDK